MRLLEVFSWIRDRRIHHEKMNLWEMANLYPNVTGINGIVVYVSSGKGLRHGPRIKVALGDKWSKDNVTIPLTGMPRVIGKANITQDQFADILQWIRQNRKLILQYWDGDLNDTKIFIDSLTPLNNS